MPPFFIVWTLVKNFFKEPWRNAICVDLNVKEYGYVVSFIMRANQNNNHKALILLVFKLQKQNMTQFTSTSLCRILQFIVDYSTSLRNNTKQQFYTLLPLFNLTTLG